MGEKGNLGLLKITTIGSKGEIGEKGLVGEKVPMGWKALIGLPSSMGESITAQMS